MTPYNTLRPEFMDLVRRFPRRTQASAEAGMTTEQISAEVDAQGPRLEAIRRALFERVCEQTDVVNGGVRACCSKQMMAGSWRSIDSRCKIEEHESPPPTQTRVGKSTRAEILAALARVTSGQHTLEDSQVYSLNFSGKRTAASLSERQSDRNFVDHAAGFRLSRNAHITQKAAFESWVPIILTAKDILEIDHGVAAWPIPSQSKSEVSGGKSRARSGTHGIIVCMYVCVCKYV